MKAYIGVDPGKNGGIALLSGSEVKAWKIPETPQEIYTLLMLLRGHHPNCFALLEVVHSSPQMGVKSAFSFGQSYGVLQMALAASGISWEGVRPQQWQKALGCLSGGEKNKTKARAQSLFPALKITHSIADSLLIAEYAKRQNL